MKKLLFITFTIIIGNQLIAQKSAYTLNEKMIVGCYGGNELTDITKKVNLEFKSEEVAMLIYASIKCRKDYECKKAGVIDEQKKAVLYLSHDDYNGFILENNEKLLVLKKVDDTYKFIGVGHIDKNQVATFSVASETLLYQDKLNNLKQVIQNLENNKENLEINRIAALDSANTFLNSKEINKDSRGLSGIYYSKIPVKTSMFLGGKKNYTKKFLVNYFEDPKMYNKIEINTQFSYETTDKNNWVRRASYTAGGDVVSVDASLKAGHAYLKAAATENGDYEFLTHSTTTDLQGNLVQGPDYYVDLSRHDEILEIEPGILLLGDFSIGKDNNNNLEYKKKYAVILVLYKADKAELAKKYTNEYCWDKIVEFQKKFEGNFKATHNKAMNDKYPMPVASSMKDATLCAQALDAVKKQAAVAKWSQTITYCYIKSSDWSIIRNAYGVITGRTIRMVAIMKNPAGECQWEEIEVKQDYNGSTYGPTYFNGEVQIIVTVDCATAMKYK